MSDAFEIGVTLALSDGVSDGIARARKDMAALEAVLQTGGVSIARLRLAATEATSSRGGSAAALPQAAGAEAKRQDDRKEMPEADGAFDKNTVKINKDVKSPIIDDTAVNKSAVPVNQARGKAAKARLASSEDEVPAVAWTQAAGIDRSPTQSDQGSAPTQREAGQARLVPRQLPQEFPDAPPQMPEAAQPTVLANPVAVMKSWTESAAGAPNAAQMAQPAVLTSPVATEKSWAESGAGTPGEPQTPLATAAPVRTAASSAGWRATAVWQLPERTDSTQDPASVPKSSIDKSAPLQTTDFKAESWAPAQMVQQAEPATTDAGLHLTQVFSAPAEAPSSQAIAWPVNPVAAEPSAPKPAMGEIKAPGNSPVTGGTSPGVGSQAPQEGDVYLDGTLVGRWMARVLAQQASRASAGPTGFDPRRSRLLPGPTVGI